ncbi:hypothetical protein CLOSTASPAR_02561 [[Clostridium] asparagiforme DSM 15981]|uniref:Uncharacterized protein n=1 Tax=[Clostridium] asparagiforme DSM 15981 TaxID=518636 RepID=C0CZY1_9FIRM|nr:hypothetical protein CLOSTASPAR_02561 [[Clostridium] asparagiforme DSM 15981]
MDIWTEAAERGVLGAGAAEVRPGRPCERIIRMGRPVLFVLSSLCPLRFIDPD